MASSVHAARSCTLARNALIRFRPQSARAAAPLPGCNRSSSTHCINNMSRITSRESIRQFSSAPQLESFAKVSSVEKEADDPNKDASAPTRFRDVSESV